MTSVSKPALEHDLSPRPGPVRFDATGVAFTMQDYREDNIICIQTAAGFRKIFGLSDPGEAEFQRIFTDNRGGFERMANMLYTAVPGETLFFIAQA